MQDKLGMRAIDYSKLNRRTDLAVIIEEFVDTFKQVLDIEFEYFNEEIYKTIHLPNIHAELQII